MLPPPPYLLNCGRTRLRLAWRTWLLLAALTGCVHGARAHREHGLMTRHRAPGQAQHHRPRQAMAGGGLLQGMLRANREAGAKPAAGESALATTSRSACPLGSACDACPQNTFGPVCTPCPRCSGTLSPHRGRCDDGLTGTGECRIADNVNVPAFASCHTLGSAPCDIAFAKPAGNLVMSTLFTSVPDPQRRVRQACIVHNRTWYTSVRDLGMSALLLHDCMSDEDVVALQTHRIRFLRVDPPPRNFSTNDYRFMLYYGVLSGQRLQPAMLDDLQLNTQWAPPVATAFLTDMFDVDFAGNPFELVFGVRYHLYMGAFGEPPAAPMPWTPWLRNSAATKCHLAATRTAQDVNMTSITLSAGMFGGPVLSLLPLLRHMSLYMLASPPAAQASNCDMSVFNVCVHDLFALDSVYLGYPLHSVIKRYENRSSGAYILHK